MSLHRTPSLQRLAHGICPLGYREQLENHEPHSELVSLDALDWSEELEAIIFAADRDFGSRAVLSISVVQGEDGETTDVVHTLREKLTCLLTLNDGACTVASDLFKLASGSSEEDVTQQGIFKMSFHLTPQDVPYELLRLGIMMDSDVAYEADAAIFSKLTQAVGLPSTLSNAGQLIAAIILATQPKELFLDKVLADECDCANSGCRYRGIPNSQTPVLRIAAEIMENGFSPDRLLYVEGAGLHRVNGFYRRHQSEPETFISQTQQVTVFRLGTGWAIKDLNGGLIYVCPTDVDTPPKYGWQDISPGGGAAPPVVSYLGASLD